MKLNPDGHHVPVLNHGGRTIADPSLIIDYISQETQSAGKLNAYCLETILVLKMTNSNIKV